MQSGTSFNFKGLEMQKLNIPADKRQRVDEKNRIIFLVLMLTPGARVIKMSKMAHFFVFFAADSKTLVTA